MWAKAAKLAPIFDIRVHDSCREFRLELLKFRTDALRERCDRCARRVSSFDRLPRAGSNPKSKFLRSRLAQFCPPPSLFSVARVESNTPLLVWVDRRTGAHDYERNREIVGRGEGGNPRAFATTQESDFGWVRFHSSFAGTGTAAATSRARSS